MLLEVSALLGCLASTGPHSRASRELGGPAAEVLEGHRHKPDVLPVPGVREGKAGPLRNGTRGVEAEQRGGSDDGGQSAMMIDC